ncbi:MAG: glycerophosphoryl diester phosphodiesterase [Candidatus Hydrogenedentota bacterium]
MKRAVLLLMLGVAGMPGCARYKAGAPHGAIDVIAHRGASAYAPENTLASFKKAEEMGADWFELDCMLSRDHEVVVIHDDTVDRTTNGHGYVRDLTLYDLKQLDAGSWKEPEFAGERIPTLAQALDYAKWKIGVYIEIKSSDDDLELLNEVIQRAEGLKEADAAFYRDLVAMAERDETRNLVLVRKVIELIRERKMKRHVVVQSFSPVICGLVRAEAPELRVEFLGSEDPDNPISWENYERLGYLMRVHGFNVHKDSLTVGRLKAFQEAGKTVAVYTVNEREEMDKFAKWGVDGIITDKPQMGLTVSKSVGRAGGPKKQ